MQAFTVATKATGYYPVLVRSARRCGYDLKTLGMGEPWTGLAGKLVYYRRALSGQPADRIVMVVDGYDVVFHAPATETRTLFEAMRVPYLLSGQRYFPATSWIRRLADRVMAVDSPELSSLVQDEPYGRPCTGALMGYAGALVKILTMLLEIEEEHRTGNDQILVNLLLARHPEAAYVDRRCQIFQSLWRTRGLLPNKGVFDPSDPTAEVEILPGGRLENRMTGTHPQVVHGPMNLNIHPLLRALGHEVDGIRPVSGFHYFAYSISTYIRILAQQQLASARRRRRSVPGAIRSSTSVPDPVRAAVSGRGIFFESDTEIPD